MPTAKDHHKLISVEDYLEGEQHSDIRHEYIDGEVFAMVGARVSHNLITGNLFAALHQHLKGKTCQPFSSDLKVKVDTRFFYPDVVVDCSGLDNDALFTEKPTLIVEVLSASTRRIDTTLKKQAYLSIPSVQEYIMIEQDFVEVEVLRRSDNWQSQHYFMGDTFHLASIDVAINVEDVYDRVNNDDVKAWLKQQAEAAEQAQNESSTNTNDN